MDQLNHSVKQHIDSLVREMIYVPTMVICPQNTMDIRLEEL